MEIARKMSGKHYLKIVLFKIKSHPLDSETITDSGLKLDFLAKNLNLWPFSLKYISSNY